MKLDGVKHDTYFAVCWECIHRNKPFDNKCKAFSNEIPLIVLNGKSKHTKPLPDQKNNIVFEKKEK